MAAVLHTLDLQTLCLSEAIYGGRDWLRISVQTLGLQTLGLSEAFHWVGLVAYQRTNIGPTNVGPPRGLSWGGIGGVSGYKRWSSYRHLKLTNKPGQNFGICNFQ